ncbi:hypothetical protein HPB50_017834 [Hyalomma asiaticum]|uniref:Uncharacterized protein n=1 Tax=Hyalomma asiaticum TaxID=266040 RepID=A0ACB7SWV2_HYAAI|nr:hypothetical protein HPB50_017834 [Hyalomma asiaticum]
MTPEAPAPEPPSNLLNGALEGFVAQASPAAIEDNTHVILGNGWYQTRVLVASTMATAVMLSQALAYELIGTPVDHWCAPPDDMRHLAAYEWRNVAIPLDEDGKFSQCKVYDPPFPETTQENDTAARRAVECQEWDYDTSNRADSIISRWDLVCGRRWLYDLSALLYMLAAVVFAPVFGTLSDRLGRRSVALMAAGMLLCASVAVAVAGTLPFFIAARLLASGSSNAVNMILFVLLYEVVGKEERTLYVVWSTGVGITIPVPFLKAVGVLQPQWALTHAVFVLPAALLALLCYSVEESPSWLISALRLRQAEQAMLIIAKENGVDLEKARNSLHLLRAQIRRQEMQHTTSSTGPFKSETGSEIVLHRAVFRRQVASVVICFVSLTFLHYVFLFQGKITSTYQAGAHLALQSCVYFTTCRFMKNKGERETLTAMLMALCLSTVAYAVAELLDLSSALFFLRSLVVALCTACLSVAYAYATNVCPISIRSTGLCFAYSCGRVGGVLGLVVAKKAKEEQPLALNLLLALMVFASGAAIQWLPEVFVKRSPKKAQDPKSLSPEQRKEALKGSIASPTRATKSRRPHSGRHSKSRSRTLSPEPVDIGSNDVNQAASPLLQQKEKTLESSNAI